ncbi:MAG: putative porin [Chitinophagales bacterium]
MKKILLFAALFLCFAGTQSFAQTQANDAEKKLNFYGDARTRLEHDWDVITSAGDTLDPRLRFRSRFRLGFTYDYNKNLSFGGRIRAGSATDQQSPHLTWGNEFATLPIGLDRAFIKYTCKGLTAWTGKNTFPFYYQDELFWDEDVSPEGLYASYEIKNEIGTLKVKPAAGMFFISSAGKPFDKDRTLLAGQIHLNHKSEKTELNLATGIFNMDSLGNLPDGVETFSVDYNLSVSNVRFTYNTAKLPITIGANVMMNLADLTDSTIVANAHDGETMGYDVILEIGKLKAAKDYLISFTYAHIEKYSIVDYFAQDDWLRWGFSGATGTRSSNFQGFEIRLAYAFGPKCNIMLRTYIVEGIAENTPGATLETNNRFRLDMNIGF